VVDAACLSHDLGHPPFGHNGELALNELAREIGGFEGNAQTLRIVARLEPKVLGKDGPAGLNLTRATLDAICKYPWARGEGPDPVKSQRKFSVYEDDRPTFDWMRQGIPAGRRCLEAQIMDLSDDIAYSVHDMEDAVATGKMDLERLCSDSHTQGVIESTMKWYGTSICEDDLYRAFERLVTMPEWMGSFSGSYADLAALKDLTSELIGRFSNATVAATPPGAGGPPPGRLAVHYVMSPRESEPVYYQQRTLLNDLVDALVNAGPEYLEPPFAAQWRATTDEGQRLRVVIDQVASLTDISASRWHARMCGMLSSQL